MGIAARLSTLSYFVANVVGLGTQEQMIWSNARRVVTVVANEQAVRYRTEVDLPR